MTMESIESTRICGKCQKEFPATTEYFFRTSRNRLFSWCKQCKQQYDRDYLRAHPEQQQKTRDRARKWHQDHPDYRQKKRDPVAVRAWKKKYYAKNKDWLLVRDRERQFGLPRGGYLKLLNFQDGRCAICGGPPGRRKLAIDHNHKTGFVRALLCGPCNTALGLVQDNANLLHKMIFYLETHAVREHLAS